MKTNTILRLIGILAVLVVFPIASKGLAEYYYSSWEFSPDQASWAGSQTAAALLVFYVVVVLLIKTPTFKKEPEPEVIELPAEELYSEKSIKKAFGSGMKYYKSKARFLDKRLKNSRDNEQEIQNITTEWWESSGGTTIKPSFYPD